MARTAVGKAKTRIVHLARTLAAATQASHGQEVEGWPDPPAGTGEYMAALELLSGGEQTAAALRQTVGAVRLRVRGTPPITQYDRVKIKATGVVYAVTWAYAEPGTGELVLTCSLA